MAEDIQFMLGQIAAKLDSIKQSLEEQKTHSASLEARIAKLEAWRWFVLGGAAALSTMANYALHLLR